MADADEHGAESIVPTIMALGDSALLLKFSDKLDERANLAASGFARELAAAPLRGVSEVVPNLVSVLLRYDTRQTSFAALSGEVRLLAGRSGMPRHGVGAHAIEVNFGGEGGPDLEDVSEMLGLAPQLFIERHCADEMRILATGFAPGFVYCGFHNEDMHVPRRQEIRDSVPAGSILFAAGQTAITSTAIPTGWHVIGHTPFRNFDPEADPPTLLEAGDTVRFRAG